MISCRDLSYYYEGENGLVPAINHLSLDIVRGEYVAIMGPNGSGKSTLAKIIAGLITPQKGSFLFDNYNINDEKNAHRILENTAIVFQNPDNQIVSMTVEAEIAFPLENLNLPQKDIRKRVDILLEAFELEHLAIRPPQSLSGGERQRVAISSVLSAGKQCLILDEPTSLLDPSGRVEIIHLLNELHQGKTANGDSFAYIPQPLTTIHITQFPEEALYAERLIILDEGKAIYDGVPEQIFKRIFDDGYKGVSVPKLLKTRFLAEKNKTDKNTGIFAKPPVENNRANEKSIYKLNNIDYSYRLPWGEHIPALRDVNCEIGRQRITGIIGSNGSGKTSLAKILSFLYRQEKGNLMFEGKEIPVSQYKDEKRKVSLSFQFPEKQFFCNTVFEEIAFGLKLRGISESEIEDRVKRSLDLVGLDYDKFYKRDPFTLSGGEKRKVGIAIALSLDAEVLIFDEPTSGLDGESQNYLINLISKLKMEGITIIVISHNIEFILSICDDVLVLTDGTVRVFTSTAKILSETSNLSNYGLPLTPYIEFVTEGAKKYQVKLNHLPTPEKAYMLF